MSRKGKVDPVLKVQLVEQYLNGVISMEEAARLAGVSATESVNQWIRIYQNDGPTGLLDQPRDRHYSKELKLKVVNDYLHGNGSFIHWQKNMAFEPKRLCRIG